MTLLHSLKQYNDVEVTMFSIFDKVHRQENRQLFTKVRNI